ncbi:MAG TPA: serine hydrolase domain-containing protein [Planctomycetota bacterium]|nr:serine hydrolase domain-containing protein [Planctomycetota bacterium]
MKRSLMATLALILLAGVPVLGDEVPQGTPESVGLSGEKLHQVDGLLEDMVAKKKLAGALVMVAKDGVIAFTGVYGKMDLEAEKPMRPDTIFRIYSMTKAIATAGALVLAEEGKLKLESPVGDVIPELKDLKVATAEGTRPASRQPTIKDLMLHDSGYLYGDGHQTGKAYKEQKPLEAPSLDEMAKRLTNVPLAFDPGSDWNYGISIDVLGLAIQRASGEPLDQFLEERIFKPLDMHDSGFMVPPEKVGRFAANYQRQEGGLKLIDEPGRSKYLKPPGLISGGGGMVSTIRDYMRFLLMVDGGGELRGVRILSPESVRLMTTNQLPKEEFPIYFGKEKRHGTGFGLGFSVRTADTEWDKAGRVGEYGWGGAASTHYWASPKDRLVVVTMEQTMPYSFDVEFAVKGPIYDAIRKP